MNDSLAQPPPLPVEPLAAPPEKTLRKLFLTLFLRGRAARGLQKASAPKSVGAKLAITLFFYGFMGFFALAFLQQPVFNLSVYLHAMNLVFLGMFVAASAGEVLFNKEEADILLHRPIEPRILLWAKIRVLVEISLWIAGAFNLVGFFVGAFARNGSWLFFVAHALSITMAALFCTSCVVLVYQLCLRWFGRERLEGLMTTAQVVLAVVVIVGGQLVPQLLFRVGGKTSFTSDSWWVGLLPPAWFAGFDDAIAGSHAAGSWLLAALGLIATTLVLWLAFGKLAHDYEAGLQTLSEARTSTPKARTRRRWLDWLIQMPPFRWWLRDSVSRAAFRLTAAYLLRDRDVKLRLYPSIAPMLVMPFVFLLQDRSKTGNGGFGIAFAGAYLGLIPMMALDLVRYSQQWQAADLFRVAPLIGPAPLCNGARRAILCFLTLPALVFFAVIAWAMSRGNTQWPLMIPGVLALPIYALIPCLNGKAVPLSQPAEEAKSANRALVMILVMIFSMTLAGIAQWSWSGGWFKWYLLVEAILVIVVYAAMRLLSAKVRWSPIE
jgi:hypothetical protein